MPKSHAGVLFPLALAFLSLALALPFGTSRLDAQANRLGAEFQVNSYTMNEQYLPSVSLSAAGDFVVAWSSVGQDGSSLGVFARRFSSAGVARGIEFQVSSYTEDKQDRPSVSLDADGDFVVAWESYGGQDGSTAGVFARRFSSAGIALAGEFQVNSHTTSYQSRPSVSLDSDGDFVIAWESSYHQDGSDVGVFARRFSSAGIALAAEFQVNSRTTDYQERPSVSLDADGDFVVAWESNGQDGSSYGIFAQRFSSAGTALGAELQVSSYVTGAQLSPSVSHSASGDFVVAWDSNGQDGSSFGVFAQRFSSAGSALASEFQVNTHTTDDQRYPSVSLDAAGDFVVAWNSQDQDGWGYGVFARHFSSAGIAQAEEFQVSSYTRTGQLAPSVSLAASGVFVVAWWSQVQDGSGYGAFAQRFTTHAVLDIDGNGATGALTDGLLVLRYLFGFTGPTLVSGAVDAGNCTRCDAAAIVEYVASKIAAQTVQSGPELQVTSYTTSYQYGPSVSLDDDGDFVVAWQSYEQDGSNYGVFARRFSSAGMALAAEFQVNSYTTSYQYTPSLSLDADGDFVIAWSSNGQDGSGRGVFARRFSSAGVPQAAEFQASTYTTGDQRDAAVALSASGDFVIAWSSFGQDGSSFGIFARRLSSQGVALATEFQINSFTGNHQRFPSLSLSASGNFVAAWEDNAQDGLDLGVFARRFSSTGVAQGADFQVSSFTRYAQRDPSVSLADDGDFVVAWHSRNQLDFNYDVFARRFSSSGIALAAELQVNSFTTSHQYRPSVSVDDGGDFVVAWESNDQDGSGYGVFARRFSSAGTALATELQINSYFTSDQHLASVSLDDGGDFVVAWASDLQDGSSSGVFAQRFRTVSAFDIDGNGATSALSDGLLVLRYLFGFTGATLVTGAVDLVNCTRCEAGPIEAYLLTLL